MRQVLDFDEILFIFSFLYFVFGVIPKEFLPYLKLQKLSFIFASTRFIVLGFILIHDPFEDIYLSK